MPTQRVPDVNGWFEVKRNPLSKVGVFPYRGSALGMTGEDADRIVMVYRPEEELSAPECIASFKLLPWVDDHTMLGPEDEGLTPAEAKGVQGVIGEDVFYDSGVLYGNIKAFSDSLARLIEAGKRQLSAGYRCVYDFTAGVFNGQRYDAVQRQIRGNHLALVQEGRMGPSVAVLDHLQFSFDAKDAIMADPKDGEGTAPAMTLPDLIKLVSQLAPQVAALQEAFGKMTSATPPAPVADADKTPPAAQGQEAGAAATGQPSGATVAPAAGPGAQDAGKAMDAALKPLREQLDGLAKSLTAMDAALKAMPQTIASETAQRDQLAGRIAAHFGTFDHADKTLAQVAAYGCEKAGLKDASKGAEVVAINAWLTGRPDPSATPTVRTSGMDVAATTGENFVTRHLSGEVAAK